MHVLIKPHFFTYDHGRYSHPQAHEAHFFDFFRKCSDSVNLHHFLWNEFWPRPNQDTTEPPFTLWGNLIPSAVILQFLRWEIQAPITITSAYRDETYNRSVGGVENSTHIRFQAIDFKSPGASPEQIREILKRWRGRWFPITSGLEIYHLPTKPPKYANGNEHGVHLFQFVGGIGTYRTFTHLDTRGYNATWKGD